MFSSNKVTINIVDAGQTIGDIIKGFVNIYVESDKLLVRSVQVQICGICETFYTYQRRYTVRTSNGTRTRTETVRVPIVYNFYNTGSVPVLDEKHYVKGMNYMELCQGVFSFPFMIKVPPNLPSACLTYIHYNFVASFTTTKGKVTQSPLMQLPLCISPIRHQAQPGVSNMPTKVAGNLKITMSDIKPAVGDTVQVSLDFNNTSDKDVAFQASFYMDHRYRNTHQQRESAIFTLGSVRSHSNGALSTFIKVPETFPTEVNIQDIHVNTFLRVIGLVNGHNKIEVFVPIHIGSDMEDNASKIVRTQAFGIQRDYTRQIIFSGSHIRFPPEYGKIMMNEGGRLMKGIEEVTSYEGVKYYVNHITRTTSMSPDSQVDCLYPYPEYNSICLPPGWSMGNDRGESVFIDHINGITSWNDPRPKECRIVPHIIEAVEAKFTVEVIRAVGLPMLTSGEPDPYVCMYDDAKDKWIKTEKVENQFDPVFKKKNVLELFVNKNRMNVVVYVYDKRTLMSDEFMGGVNFDLQYFPPNVTIEDWFGLSNFGNEKLPTTGKVLLRVRYSVDASAPDEVVKISGHGSSNLDYYAITDKMESQLEKQEKHRLKKKKGECPTIKFEGKLICQVPMK